MNRYINVLNQNSWYTDKNNISFSYIVLVKILLLLSLPYACLTKLHDTGVCVKAVFLSRFHFSGGRLEFSEGLLASKSDGPSIDIFINCSKCSVVKRFRRSVNILFIVLKSRPTVAVLIWCR